MGYLNIDILGNTKDHYNYLSSLCDTFSLNNLIKDKTCIKADSGTTVDVMLTNRPRNLHKTSIILFLRTHFERLKSKKLKYRNYKKFEKNKLLFELDQELLKDKLKMICLHIY